jgi:hypothetical protein
MSSVVPLPLPVEMLAVNDAHGTPPLRAPVVPLITHAAELPVALKLPLDWAKASPDASTATPKNTVKCFILQGLLQSKKLIKKHQSWEVRY